jgi:hypothetical protein
MDVVLEEACRDPSNGSRNCDQWPTALYPNYRAASRRSSKLGMAHSLSTPVALSVVHPWYPSLAIAFLAQRRIDSAAELHGLNGRQHAGAVAGGTSLLSGIGHSSFHSNLSRRNATGRPSI